MIDELFNNDFPLSGFIKRTLSIYHAAITLNTIQEKSSKAYWDEINQFDKPEGEFVKLKNSSTMKKNHQNMRLQIVSLHLFAVSLE